MEAMKKKFLNMRSFREITWKSSIDLPMLKSFFSFFDLSGTVSFITCHVPFSCKNINLRLQRTYPCLWSASLKTCGERVRDFSTSASPGRALSKSDAMRGPGGVDGFRITDLWQS
ncbi:hypothetical protein YC2023_001658 [Brassica napus]